MTEREHITDRAHGIDTYTGQYRRDYYGKLILPKYSEVYGQLDFSIIKTSEGYWPLPTDTKSRDEFRQLWDAMAAPVPLRGIYHYQRSGVSWLRQADNVLSMQPADSQFMVVDLEQGGNVIDKTMVADTFRILRYWKENTTRRIMYYAGMYTMRDIVLPIMRANWPADKWYEEFALWMPQYYLLNRGPNRNPSIISNFTIPWRIWQYTDSGDSYPYKRYGSPDLNVFNGTVADMAAFLHVSVQPPQPVERSVVSIVDETGQEYVKA